MRGSERSHVIDRPQGVVLVSERGLERLLKSCRLVTSRRHKCRSRTISPPQGRASWCVVPPHPGSFADKVMTNLMTTTRPTRAVKAGRRPPEGAALTARQRHRDNGRGSPTGLLGRQSGTPSTRSQPRLAVRTLPLGAGGLIDTARFPTIGITRRVIRIGTSWRPQVTGETDRDRRLSPPCLDPGGRAERETPTYPLLAHR
jgi:hypothetical protein